MITEIADFAVLPDKQEEFADAVREGLALVAGTPGFRRARLTRSIETPTRFVLLIEWDSVEAHTVGFRESEAFPKWRAIVGPFFDGAPTVEHVEDLVTHP
ncbi:antibiotic biosynthesis monooxygenase family protein [Pseudonocardia abyssalis]|uniref:Antibiotic biosynthesis monooxygenase n=1 Tax=Pseudonocardia abyssalis TaxID=2792008 RepID=A0ABS6UNV7_9PSEU|nr:antibiotic biosynthesis monooxygenase family protein [Pseudonocardia abyssalis]MBW0115250.1 antibiotic biosynthesis monooxygenase [Pseudonocardia abyssalis]MBW0133646.1 antibiotic biosynthesis monooxygenase [Pseudonocardia abyssalis]